MFITFEGAEGSGKSSQAAALAQWLRSERCAAPRVVVLTREPGGTRLGERLRELFLQTDFPLDAATQLLLLSAARRQHLHEVVLPALARGEVVLCDRYSDSTRAYQGGGEGLAVETVESAIRLATDGREADLTLYLDLDPELGLRRRRAERDGGAPGAAAGWNRFDAREPAFHTRVRRGYLELAARERNRIVTIDASRPFEAVAQEIQSVVCGKLSGASSGGTS